MQALNIKKFNAEQSTKILVIKKTYELLFAASFQCICFHGKCRAKKEHAMNSEQMKFEHNWMMCL